MIDIKILLCIIAIPLVWFAFQLGKKSNCNKGITFHEESNNKWITKSEVCPLGKWVGWTFIIVLLFLMFSRSKEVGAILTMSVPIVFVVVLTMNVPLAIRFIPAAILMMYIGILKN